VTTAALILAALCCCAAAAVLNLLNRRRARALDTLAFLVLAAGSVVVAVAGFRATLGHGGTLDLGTTLGFGHAMLRADPLSGLFLALTGVVAAPVMFAFAGWARRRADLPYRPLPATVALTVAGIIVVVTADNAFVFLFAWEAVSVAFFLLAGYRRDRRDRGRAAMLTFAFSKTSGALLLIAFSLLAARTGSFAFADWAGWRGSAHDAAYALSLVAFTAKVGVVPLQVWMPTGYAAAPGPARALMSAVAANIGFYGMWRTLQVLGKPPTWIAVLLLLTAAFTALLGIAHAAVQRDLHRVIAYSSVENGGLITAAYGVALAGTITGHQQLAAVGLLASALQMVTHALAKSALFLAGGRLEQRTGETDLDRLLATGRDETATGVAFSLGAFSLAGLPLTVGFVSEWFILEAIMQLFRVGPLPLQLTLAVTGAAIALTAGYAGFTFVRLVGLTILGRRAAGVPPPRARDVPPLGALGRVGLLTPAIACVGLFAFTPWEIRFLAHGLTPIVPAATTTGALASPWVLQPVYDGFSVLSPSWLSVELPLLFLATLAFAAWASRGSMFRVRRVPAWRSATGGVSGDARYTAFAFANPTRHVLGNLLMTRAGHVEVDAEARAEEDAASAFPGPDMPPGEQPTHGSDGHHPAGHIGGAEPMAATQMTDQEPNGHHHATYTTDVVELVETFVYRPLLRPLTWLVRTVKRLQSGRLDAYIAYMLVALLALLAIVVGFA
jgi:formate hydrogenlyase subunit 3/multisubunit Na+/H+ antiporter MnhD subunit